MDRILKGVMKYRDVGKDTMLKQFQRVRDNPTVSNEKVLLTIIK